MIPRSISRLLGLAAVLGLVLPAAPARGAEIFPYEVHQKTLDNGLSVVVVPYDSPGVVAYFTVVRAGSRQEVEAGHSGFAHFFEHMMFRGTERFTQDEYNDVLKGLGADSNAFTTDDYTNYHIVAPASSLETLMDIESDRFRNLEYPEADFRTEALAVLGEYNKNASNPFFRMFERMREMAFEKHTYAHTTMGFLADIEAMPGYYDYSLSFFDRFYRPDNVAVLIVGDVTPERVFELAQKYYGPWEAGFEPVEIERDAPQEAAQRDRIEWPNPTRPYLMMGYRTPEFSTASAHTAALDVIAQLLFSQSAPLYQELVVDKQWVDFLSGGAAFRRDPYLFTISARVRSDELLPQVEERIEQELAALQREEVAAERLERIKSHLRYQVALGLDSASSVAYLVADFLNLTGNPQTINELYEQFEKLTPADVQRVAREVFDARQQTLVTLVHPENPSSEAADDAAAGR